ncbi:MAG: beta-galactosidase [Spirochaetota bacterium]|mgnify:CR=1 FL=1
MRRMPCRLAAMLPVAFMLAASEPNANAPAGARIAVQNDIPTLAVDGKPHSGMSRHGYQWDAFAGFRPTGVTLYIPILTASQGFWVRSVWTAPDTWDYSNLDKVLDGIFEKIPDAHIILKLSESAPDWWRAQHTNELVHVIESNETVPLLLPPADHRNAKYGRKTVPSWASHTWRRDIASAIVHVMRHLGTKPYAKRIVGFLICSGESNEWFAWGNRVDHSPANIARFRAWLWTRYRDVSALRSSWHDPAVSFENARPPLDSAVASAARGSLRNADEEMRTIDYLDYNSFMTASAIDELAASIKQSASFPVVVGAYYGYLTSSDPRWGHQDIGTLLAGTNIDFLCSPTAYWEHRRLGIAAPAPMAAVGSVSVHGKYWFNENDNRTSATGSGADWFQGKVEGIEGDKIMQRRELGWTIAHGFGQWWQDVGTVKFDSPALLTLLSNYNAIAEASIAVSRRDISHAAAVIDPRSVYYIKPEDYLLKELRRLSIDALQRSGIASSIFSSDDLLRLTDKRLILFCDMIAPSPETMAAVDRLKSDGRVLVFHWAAGSVRNGRSDAGAMQKLTGIKIRQIENASLRVTVSDRADARSAGISYGPDRTVSPAYIPDDDDGEIWGRLRSGEPALMIRRYPTWTAVYSSAPMLPPEILAVLGDIAKAHRYTQPGDALWVTKGMLALSAFRSGEKTVRFPARVRLFECFDGADLRDGTEFIVPMKENETKLFRIE